MFFSLNRQDTEKDLPQLNSGKLDGFEQGIFEWFHLENFHQALQYANKNNGPVLSFLVIVEEEKESKKLFELVDNFVKNLLRSIAPDITAIESNHELIGKLVIIRIVLSNGHR